MQSWISSQAQGLWIALQSSGILQVCSRVLGCLGWLPGSCRSCCTSQSFSSPSPSSHHCRLCCVPCLVCKVSHLLFPHVPCRFERVGEITQFLSFCTKLTRLLPMSLPMLLPCCSHVAPVLLPCCSRVAPVLLPSLPVLISCVGRKLPCCLLFPLCFATSAEEMLNPAANLKN